MDLPPPVQEPDAARTGELEWRLSQLESGLRHIDRRLDRLQESIAETVAEHTQAVGRDLRHTVSELGRRLVLELPQVLARHRDEIVAELRPPEPTPVDEPAADSEPDDADPEDAAPEDAAPAGPEPAPEPETGTAEAESPPEAGTKRRRRVHVLRRDA